MRTPIAFETDEPMTPAGLPPAKLRRAILFISAVMYALLVGTAVLSPEADRFWPKVVGPNPLGVPAKWFMAGVLTLWYAPYLYFWRHMVFMMSAAAMNRRLGWGFAPFLVGVVRFGDRDERRSAAAALAGVAYFFGSAAAWIAYTAWRGI